MRRRLLASTLTIALATVTLFGFPLAFVLDRVVHDEAQSRVERDAIRVAAEIQPLIGRATNDPALAAALRRIVPSGDRVVVVFPDHSVVATAPKLDDALVARVPGPSGTRVRVESPEDPVNARVQRALLFVVVLALAGLGGAFMLAFVQSVRLATPLARLARSATRLGEGDFSLATPRSGVPEIDEIATALDRSAQRIDALLHAERSFSANASHQLRTALTGLQLRIEELSASEDPAVRAEAEAALEQSSRLSRTIDELLALARTGRAGIVTNFDLAQLARAHVVDLAPLLAQAGRALVVRAAAPVPVFAAVGAVGQVLDILLSNAVRHGAGAVTVEVTSDARHAILDVGDEGRGFGDPAGSVFEAQPTAGGHGIGLALARTLVMTEGGTITLVRARPPLFRVELPRA